jgi:carboxymethylenebutenolidase
MDRRLIDLHHDYVHHHFDRRKFLQQAARIVGSTAAATALLPLLDCDYALAQTVAEGDPRISAERVTFPGVTGEVKAYLAKPRAPGRYPSVVIVHEAGGLNPHTMDVARRFAAEGFTALAVDFLSPLGGTPAPAAPAAAPAVAPAAGAPPAAGGGGGGMINRLDPVQTTGNGIAAAKWLRARPESNGKVGVVGFCWGGRVVQQMSVNDPSLNAVVSYYGQPPNPAEAPKLNAPLLMNMADVMLDMNNTGEATLYSQELKKLGKTYELQIYPGAMHGFNNNTNTPRYNKMAAELSWGRTIGWFKKYLS